MTHHPRDLVRDVERGRRIHAARKRRDLTLEEVSSIVGVGVPHLSKVERGLERPSAGLLGNLAALYREHPADLVGDYDLDLARQWLRVSRTRSVTRDTEAERVVETLIGRVTGIDAPKET